MNTIRSVNAHDVFRSFINRQSDVDHLAGLIRTAEGGRIGGVLAWPDSGLTTSLRQAQSQLGSSINVVPIDLNNSHPDALLLQTLQFVTSRGKEFSREILLRLARPGKQDVLSKIISSSVGDVPGLGPSFSRLSDLAFNLVSPDFDTIRQNKKLSDIFELISQTGKTCVVADHFQSAQAGHLTQFANMLSANPGVSVLAAQNTDQQVPSAQLLDSSLGSYLGAVAKFPRPDAHLAELILADVNERGGLAIQSSQVPDIRQGLHAFLSQVYRLVLRHGSQPNPLEQIHLDILCILKTANMATSAHVIFHALVRGKLFVLDSKAVFAALDVLEQHGLIAPIQAGGMDRALALTSQGEARARQELEPDHRVLLFSELLYRGVVELIEDQKAQSHMFAPMLYRLAGIVDQAAQSKWRMATIKSCIATSNFFEASAMLDRVEVTLPRQNDEDTLTVIAALVAVKKYTRALELCSEIANGSSRISILRAVLLYRSLKLEDAYLEMKSLLRAVHAPEERCLLGVYYVGLSIDRGDIDGDAKELIASVGQFSDTRHFGYLQNIIAATLPPTDALDFCRASISIFEKRGDAFGLAGAWANIGVHQIKAGELKDGLETSKSAYRLLSKFGIQHIHLVANNIASASLLQGDLAEAENSVREALNLLQTSTIRINALINLAAIEFVRGNRGPMRTALSEAISQAERQPIGHARARALEAAKVLTVNDPEIQEAILGEFNATLSPEEAIPSARMLSTNASQNDRVEHLRQHYRPPTNQYWFPNPMDLFQGKSLSVEAFGQDVAH